MQLIVAIVQDKDVNRLTKALNEHGFRTTKLASTGGFLKRYNTTLIIGCQEEYVDEALEIIKEHSSARREQSPTVDPERATQDLFKIKGVKTGGATVFVLPVEKFFQF